MQVKLASKRGFCFGVEDFADITPATFVTFVAGRESARSGGVRFSPNNFLGVSLDIAVDGGLAGAAAMESVVVFLGSAASDEDTACVFSRSPVRLVNAGRDALGGRGRGRRVGA